MAATPDSRPARLAVTPGEPAGIGPDLLIQLVQRPQAVQLVALADPALLAARAAQLGLPLRLVDFDPANRSPAPAGTLQVAPVPLVRQPAPGQPETANAPALLAALERAVVGCRTGEFDALVTGPLHKAVINEAGIAFSGHTEYLATLTQTPMPVMLLVAPGLRVALVTTHLPLRAVADAITPARLTAVLEVLHGDLQRRYGFAQPRILVCGLNPHAGEGGHLGSEERERIAPTLARLRARGWQLTGPLPADTAFTPPPLAQHDAVLAMYHDQGLPVLKHLGFGRSVNVTLGLPIVRTSVDHGTALALAGSGRIELGSLEAAIAEAARLAARA